MSDRSRRVPADRSAGGRRSAVTGRLSLLQDVGPRTPFHADGCAEPARERPPEVGAGGAGRWVQGSRRGLRERAVEGFMGSVGCWSVRWPGHQARLRICGLFLARRVAVGCAVLTRRGFTRRGYASPASFSLLRALSGLPSHQARLRISGLLVVVGSRSARLTRRGYARQVSSSLVGSRSELPLTRRGCASRASLGLVVEEGCSRFVCSCSPGAVAHRDSSGCGSVRPVGGSHQVGSCPGPLPASRTDGGNGSSRGAIGNQARGVVSGPTLRGRARRPPPRAPTGGNDRGRSGDQPVTGGPGPRRPVRSDTAGNDRRRRRVRPVAARRRPARARRAHSVCYPE